MIPKSIFNAVANISQSLYDRFVETNVKARLKSGAKSIIVRRQLGKCCDWCARLAGVYEYGTEPREVYQRHDNCKCMVTARTEKGYTDVWSKIDYKSQQEARVAREKELQRWGKPHSPISLGLILQKVSTQTGGHHYPFEKGYTERDKKAAKAYERIVRTNDIDAIAKNGEVSREEAVQIKNHVFFAKHKLYESYARFAPDYNMAVAWDRIAGGRQLPRDLTLLQHELLESQVEREYNLTASEAHRHATTVHDWWKQLMQETDGAGEPDGLL